MPPKPDAKLFTSTSWLAEHHLLWCTTTRLAALSPQWLKTVARHQSWAMRTYHKFSVVWAPHVRHAPKRGRHGADYDHLRRHHISWTVMAHHESHCERIKHLQKMHFHFGVIMASFWHVKTDAKMNLALNKPDRFLFIQDWTLPSCNHNKLKKLIDIICITMNRRS
jgi:hypothetical protein